MNSYFSQYRLRNVINLLFLFNYCQFGYSQTVLTPSTIDTETLNNFIINEVNKYRVKVKVDSVHNEYALILAAEDHAKYMLKRRKLTHYQKYKKKKTPKNRVDFYGEQFDRVGENVQKNNLNLDSSPDDKHHPLINSYEKLAEALVLTWRNSPPHYANMINPDFKTTYTSVVVGDNGELYACQLFGGAIYKDVYIEERDTSFSFKPDRKWRCWRCKIRPPSGSIEITEDSTIIFKYTPRRMLGIVIPSVSNSRMRLFNPWRDGLAADIIVKSQYTCDSNSYHNGLSNFRGIPLAPVYKKDYMGIPIDKTKIVLGKVPAFINEEFEVNLVVIQNKRPCSNTLFYVMLTDFQVEIPLNYGFEPSEALLKYNTVDTLSKRMYFEKSMISPKDTILEEIIVMLKKDLPLIKSVKISGFASIEGTTENNKELYKNRTDYLLQQLISIGIDSTIIQIESGENFNDFRKDIVGTEYEYLNNLSDSELKIKLSNKELSSTLEFILSAHRYVNLMAITSYDYQLEYNKEIVNEQLRKTIKKENIKKSIEFQEIQYGLALSGDMTLKEIEMVDIPMEKKNQRLMHNRAVMRFQLDTMSIASLKTFRADLWQIRELDKNDERLNTSIAIIDYHLYSFGQYHHKKITFYDSIRKWKYIDEVQRARILLNVAFDHDYGVWLSTGSYKEKKYWYRKAKRYVQPAKLDTDKTFEIATYYSFFWQHDYAYELTKGKIDETEDPYDLIFFLKLIHLTNVDLPRKTYLKYFKKIQKYAGKDFCTFFNSPALNFQIFDDPEIKEIYCKECGKK